METKEIVRKIQNALIDPGATGMYARGVLKEDELELLRGNSMDEATLERAVEGKEGKLSDVVQKFYTAIGGQQYFQSNETDDLDDLAEMYSRQIEYEKSPAYRQRILAMDPYADLVAIFEQDIA